MLIVAELTGHVAGGPGPWWPIFPILWLVFLSVVAIIFFRSRQGWKRGGVEDVLAERYARGEITVDEYRERLNVLKRHTQ